MLTRRIPTRLGRRFAATACLAGGLVTIVIGTALPTRAETLSPITFESYTTGSVNGQDGWVTSGPADQAVVLDSAYAGAPAGFGTRSLRASDANANGQTYSKSTADAAGEAGADAGGFPTGTLRTNFTASFDFASVTPAAQQTQLQMAVSPDRGDGAHMSNVRIEDTATGWNVWFSDYRDVAPLGSSTDIKDGCHTGDGFVETRIASSLTRTAHRLGFIVDLVPGPHNGVVQVVVDGSVVHTGTSWEDYYRYCPQSGGGSASDQTRIIRNLRFGAGDSSRPAHNGNGMLFDNISVATASLAD